MSHMQRPGPYESAYRGTGGPEPPDPQERLKQLQIELDQHKARIDSLTKQESALQTDFDDLSKTVTQVNTTLGTYGSGVKGLVNRLQALQTFHDTKNKMVLAGIGDKKGPIDDLVREYDYQIEKMHERLTELKESKDAAQQESQQANDVQNAKQAAYDTANNYENSITTNLTDLESLRAQITTADGNDDIASEYFLMREFDTELGATHIIPQHQLALELKQKLGELEAAKEHARAKSAALDALQAEYTAHQTTLQNKTSGRRANLLAAVQALFPVPPASTATGGTATTTTPAPAAASPAAAPKK